MSNEDKNLEKETGSCNRCHKIKIIIDKIIQYVVLFIVIYVFIINPVIYINHIFTLPINRFNFQVANYDMTYRILNNFNSCRLGKTQIAYGLRYILFKQYKHIVKTGKSNVYNNIGVFYNIHKDFVELTASYDNNGSKSYTKYKEKYLLTIENILSDYENRNITTKQFLSNYAYGRYNIQEEIILNRITFYLELAESLYEYGNLSYIPSTYENLKKLKEIFNRFDTIVNQEKTLPHSYNIEKFDEKRNLKKYDALYPAFIYNYSKEIIKMEYELSPDTFCENKDLFNKYYSIQNIYSSENINNLINTKCSYK